MTCLEQEQFVQMALGLAGRPDWNSHVAGCPRCASELSSTRILISRLGAAHAGFDVAAPAVRDRLLASLPEVYPRRAELVRQNSVIRRTVAGGIGAAALIAIVALAWTSNSTRQVSAMERMAENIRRAKSYQAEVLFEVRPPESAAKPQRMSNRYLWLAPSSYRIEAQESDFMPGGHVTTDILFGDKPGIHIDHTAKSFSRVARRGSASPLIELDKLGNYSGKADGELGTKQIDGRNVQGFAIDARKVDPATFEGRLEIWLDRDTNLPAFVRYEFELSLGARGNAEWRHITWNTELKPELFAAEAPAGYQEKKQAVPALAEQVQAVIDALRIYAELSGGHYPQMPIYGDVMGVELFKLAGIKTLDNETLRSPKYGSVLKAQRGFTVLGSILRDSPDATYHGKAVGPRDTNKVLVRWKMEDGFYQVIYGDLKSETVSGERLRGLEKSE